MYGRALRAPVRSRRLPARFGRTVTTAPPPAFSSLSVDFTALSAQDPLSASGLFSNNTQGVGGNVAPTTGTSMRLAAMTGTSTVICCGSVAAQVDFEDSFAFVPISNLAAGSNVRVRAEVAVASGYNPSDNHELEIIIGCKTSASYHRWIECLWSKGGAHDCLSLDGDFINGTFTSLTNDGGGEFSGGHADHDIFIAEYYPSAGRVRWGRIRTGVNSGNPLWSFDVTDPLINGTLGNGFGLAAFRRFIAPDSVSASLGFYNLLIQAF